MDRKEIKRIIDLNKACGNADSMVHKALVKCFNALRYAANDVQHEDGFIGNSSQEIFNSWLNSDYESEYIDED